MSELTVTAKIKEGELIEATIEGIDFEGNEINAENVSIDNLPAALSGTAVLRKLKAYERLYNEAKSELDNVKAAKRKEIAQAISAIKETSAKDVEAEKQRRLADIFELAEILNPDGTVKVTAWEKFLQVREDGVREASELLSVIQSGDATEDQQKRAAQLRGANDAIRFIEGKAKEILSTAPLPMDVTKNELWS